MEKKKRTRQLIVFAAIVLALFVGALLCPGGGIRTSMMMSLVFIETVIIYALIVAILLIFVL